MTADTSRQNLLLASVLMASLVCVVLPMSMYLGNLSEFQTAPGAILPLLMAPAMLLVGMVWLGLKLARRAPRTRLVALLAAITVLAWVQAYLLVWDYGLLDGSPVDWDSPTWRPWVDGSVWVVGVAAAALWPQRLQRPLVTAALVVVALQAALVAASAFQHRDALALKASKRLTANKLQEMARFSSDRNVLHIVLDSFQADIFKEIVSGPDGAAIQAAMPGFTFFEEHLGTYPATYLALPVIVSGRPYLNDMPKPAYMDAAFGEGSILTAAQRAGFEVDVASDAWMLDLLMKAPFDNAYLTAQLPIAQEAARVLDLALFRLAPHPLKPWVYQNQQWLTQRLVTRSVLERFAYFAHNAFFAYITRHFSADRAAPVYKFFHVMTTHAPFVVNPDCSPAGQVLPRTRETVIAQSRCSLAFVVGLLNRMKQAGVYGDSLIVLMADHGGHIAPERYRHEGFVTNGVQYDLRPDYVGLATPLLAVKPPGATGPFAVSPVRTSMTDVAATIAALAGLGGDMPGTSIWGPGYGLSGTRRFFGYEWSKMNPVHEYISGIEEYLVKGSAYDAKSWSKGPSRPPPDEH